jgi:uncharacterized lipoprotein YddW (UPF0748 family)
MKKESLSGRIITTILLASVLQMYSQFCFAQAPKREMRAVWIATVGNIDWPSKPGLPVDQQKKELTAMLDRFREYNLNTVVFQIRPAADAYYSSAIEPWSQWLNGKQGQAPEPFYDPLEFMINECRARGLAVHAWLNPYRAITDTAGITAMNHITRLHPEWFVTYGKTVYFDPGLPETRNYFARVVSDVVRRYDIDAIHMDDYFYPYRIANVTFPDDSSFVKHAGGFSPERRDDWRRENVNLIIKQLRDSIKSIKPWVEFGISPFGVWRNIEKDPAGSATKAGQTNYDDLFADILSWEKNGFIDYVVPQIYWHIGFKVADYPVLAEWWSNNAYGCNLYIGQAPYRIDRKSSTKQWRRSREILKQIEINRTYPNIGGSMYFSAKVLLKNPLRLEQHIVRKLYRYPALVPGNNRISPVSPDLPENASKRAENGMLHLSWDKGAETRIFVIYKFRKGKTADLNNPENIRLVTSETQANIMLGRSEDPEKYNYYITSVSKTNTESNPVMFKDVK